MDISVAMAIYNGERFLLKQLESLYQQTLAIDELIACDDGSTDSSREIFESFVKSHGLTNKWHYIVNEKKKGYAKNFLDCASLCTKDIIFFSDQDDIWDRTKVEKMMEVFYTHRDAMAVCCSVKCIDETDKEQKDHLYTGHPDDSSVIKVPFELQVKSMRSSGLSLAIRRESLLPTKRIIEEYGLHYDSTFGLIYAARGEFYRVYQPLVFHRIHGSNAGNPSYSLRTRRFDNHISSRKNQLKLLKTILSHYNDVLSETQCKALALEINSREKAIKNMEEGKLLPLLIGVFRIGPMNNKAIDMVNFALTAKKKLSRR